MFLLNKDDDLKQLKDMLRILTNDDDALLKGYLLTAESSVQTAVGEDKDGEFYQRDDIKPMYQTACFALTGTYYTYRVSGSDGNIYPINDTANALIGQMRAKFTSFKRGGHHG